MRTTSRRLAAVAVLAAALVAMTGCIPSIPMPPSPPTTTGPTASGPTSTTPPAGAGLDDYLTAATAQGGSADGTRTDEVVRPGAGGSLAVTDRAIAVNGGSVEIAVDADAPFDTVLVGVGPTAPGSATPTAWDGAYDIALDAPTTSTSIVVTLSQTVPSTQFSVVVAVVAPDGTVSLVDATPVSIVEVGTGDVQVSVSWSDDSDVDLYVVDPSGETVYYGATSSASGGQLDLDSNASCTIDGIRNENVTWPTGEAPSGTYEVRVNLWADCGVDRTSWVVTVNAIGQTYRWEGILDAPGNNGGVDDGIVVGRFDVP